MGNGLCESTKNKKDDIKKNPDPKDKDKNDSIKKDQKDSSIQDTQEKDKDNLEVKSSKLGENSDNSGNNEDNNQNNQNMDNMATEVNNNNLMHKNDSSSNDSAEDKKELNEPNIMEVTIKFTEKGEEKFTSKFDTNLPISTIYKELNEQLNKYSEYDLLTENNESLQEKKDIKIFKVFPDKSEIELNIFYLGLEIPNEIRKEYENCSTIIASPLLDIGDTIGLILYNKFNQQITSKLLNIDSNQNNNNEDQNINAINDNNNSENNSQNDPNEDLPKIPNKKLNLSVFTHISSYCNGDNKLYISGGENNSQYINDFISINLLDTNIIERLPDLITPRGWHTMIFIPNRYIFIVSGSSITVELYDLEKKTITNDSELNVLRREPTCCCINNSFLFVIGGFVENENFLDTIEKCNLRQAVRKWEFVEYTSSDSIAAFQQCYYICSYFSECNIILFACNEDGENKKMNLLFDFEDEGNNYIQKYDNYNSDFIVDACPEKFFHPIDNNGGILFPMINNVVKMYKLDGNMKLKMEEFPNVLDEIYG